MSCFKYNIDWMIYLVMGLLAVLYWSVLVGGLLKISANFLEQDCCSLCSSEIRDDWFFFFFFFPAKLESLVDFSLVRKATIQNLIHGSLDSDFVHFIICVGMFWLNIQKPGY